MDHPQISVVSLTWNSSAFVEPMLSSLLKDADTSNLSIDVIIVDNGSRDDTLQQLERFQASRSDIRVVPLSRNLGTTLPRNIGVRMARAPYVLILDSDTEIPEGTLHKLLIGAEQLSKEGDLGMLCPKLVYPNGDFQESARRFPTALTKLYRLFRMEGRRVHDETIDAVLRGEVTTVDYAISAAWLLPRKTFERAGFLDEEIFYAPEDVEYCARLWSQGLKVWYYPEVHIVHNCQRITNKKPLSKLGFSHLLGLVRYWRKYGAFLRRPG